MNSADTVSWDISRWMEQSHFNIICDLHQPNTMCLLKYCMVEDEGKHATWRQFSIRREHFKYCFRFLLNIKISKPSTSQEAIKEAK